MAVRTRGKFGSISMRDWEPIGAGGESGMTAGDPLHPGIIFGGTGTRFDLELNSRGADDGAAHAGADAARTDWTQPLVFSKADPHALYYANQFLFKTTDDAQTWTQISPRPDASRSRRAGEPRRGRRRRTPIATASAASSTRSRRRRSTRRSSGSAPTTASIQVTTDDGKTWQNVTPPAVTPGAASRRSRRRTSMRTRRTRRSIGISSTTSIRTSTARATSARRGRRSRGACRPASTCTWSRKIRRARGLLFAGTERGVYVSFDDGDNWQSLQLNLPVTSMRDFEIHGDDLIVAHARPRLLGDRRHQPAAPAQRRRSRAPTRICSSRPTRST